MFSITSAHQNKEPSVTFIGSLYNEDTLKTKLSISKNSSTETLILKAFEKWRTKLINYFDGEFFLALYIPSEKFIFCARDKLGITPFYYHHSNNGFFASDTISQIANKLVSNKKTKLTQNLGFVAEYLCQNICSTEDTIYTEIKRLPASHSLTVKKKTLKIDKYYTPKISSYPTNYNFSEDLRKKLIASCSKRALDKNSLAVYLSGGIDSSIIAACLEDINPSSFQALSMKFSREDCDESQYIIELQKRFKHSQHWCCPSDNIQETLDSVVSRFKDLPDYANNAFSEPLLKKAQSLGLKNIMSGVGGDELFTGGTYPYTYLTKNLKLQTIYKQLKKDPRLYSYISNFTPQKIKNIIRKNNLSPNWIPAFFETSFIKESKIEQRLKNHYEFSFSRSLQKQKIEFAVFSGLAQLGLEQNYRHAKLHNLTHSHPFLDPSLLELALSIPEEKLHKNGLTKYILRKSFKEMLPATIIKRKDKANFSYIFPTLIKTLGGRKAFKNLALYDLAVLNRTEVLKLHDSLEELDKNKAFESINKSYQLWAILSVDAAARNLF